MGWGGFPYELVDLYSPTEPGSCVHGVQVDSNGVWRVSRRGCELHSVKILVQGSSGLFDVMTGTGRSLFRQPSCFTGSWPVGCFAEEGLIMVVHCGTPPSVQVSFRETDDRIV